MTRREKFFKGVCALTRKLLIKTLEAPKDIKVSWTDRTVDGLCICYFDVSGKNIKGTIRNRVINHENSSKCYFHEIKLLMANSNVESVKWCLIKEGWKRIDLDLTGVDHYQYQAHKNAQK